MKVVMHTNIKNFCCERGRMTANGRQVDVNAIKTFLDAIWIFLQSKKSKTVCSDSRTSSKCANKATFMNKYTLIRI